MKTLLVLGILLAILCSSCSPPAPQQRVHLTLWQGVNPPANRQVLQKLVDRFNQSQSRVFVESLYVGQPDQQIPKILTGVLGNAVPDLLWFNPTITGKLVELGALRPIDDLLQTSPLFSTLDPAMLSTMKLGEHLWSIPFAANNVALFYRPSLFAAAGITDLPRDWAAFQSASQKLTQDKNGDGTTDQYAIFLPLGKGEFTVFIWLPFFWSAGGEINEEKPQLNTPEAIAALHLWQDLVIKGQALLSQPERGYEEENFFAGKVAMQISGSWALRYIQQKGIDFGVMPLPFAKEPATAIGGENLFLFRSTPDREAAAWQFMEYVLGETFQTAWATETGYLPINLVAQQSKAYHEYIEENPLIRIFLGQMTAGHTRPLVSTYTRISENLGRAIESTLLQKKTAAQALQEAQDRLSLFLSKNPR